MPTTNGVLKTRELKLQGTSNADFKLKVEDDELHIKRGNMSLMTIGQDDEGVLSGNVESGMDKISISAPVTFKNKAVFEKETRSEGNALAMHYAYKAMMNGKVSNENTGPYLQRDLVKCQSYGTVAVNKEGKVWESFGGLCHSERPKQNMWDGDTINTLNSKSSFKMASVEKSYVIFILGRLIDKGKIDLDADVNDYLKWDAPVRNPAFPDVPITARMLCSMSSGIKGYMTYDAQMRYLNTLSKASADPTDNKYLDALGYYGFTQAELDSVSQLVVDYEVPMGFVPFMDDETKEERLLRIQAFFQCINTWELRVNLTDADVTQLVVDKLLVEDNMHNSGWDAREESYVESRQKKQWAWVSQEPGTVDEYSDTSYALLVAAMVKASGLSDYKELVEVELCVPLNFGYSDESGNTVKTSGYGHNFMLDVSGSTTGRDGATKNVYTIKDGHKSHMQNSFNYWAPDGSQQFVNLGIKAIPYGKGAAEMITNFDDYVKFMVAFLHKFDGVWTHETFDLLVTNNRKTFKSQASRDVDPYCHGLCGNFEEYYINRQGLVDADLENDHQAGHSGSEFGAKLWFCASVNAGVGYIHVQSGQDGYGTPKGMFENCVAAYNATIAYEGLSKIKLNLP